MKHILLVEDDLDDIFLVKTACDRSGIPHSLHTVRDGVEAMAYLSGEGAFADRDQHPLPQLIFLDIRMPKKDGFEVLQWIRSQAHFTNLPVIMLTTSQQAEDIHQSYRLGANSFLRKREDMAEFTEGMRIVLKYWLGYNIGAP